MSTSLTLTRLKSTQALPIRQNARRKTVFSTSSALFMGFFALYMAVGFWLVLFEHSIMEDAISRVSNASYVLYSREPKLANVGFVWTPLPSLILLPFLPLKFLWPALVEQGLLANVVSAAAMSASVRVLLGLLGDLGVPKRVRLILVVAYGLQPLIVWFGANGMTEALLLLFLLLASRGLVRWIKDEDPRHLMYAAAFLALGYLSRYEMLAAGAAATVLVATVTWFRTPQSRSARRASAAADAMLVGLPLTAAFTLWAAASWAIVGHPFEQFTSSYGNSAIIDGGGTGVTIHPTLLILQWLVLAPLGPVVAIAAAFRARRTRELGLAAPVALLAAVIAFEFTIYLSGSLFGFLRYQIAVIPLFFVLVGSLYVRRPYEAALPKPDGRAVRRLLDEPRVPEAAPPSPPWATAVGAMALSLAGIVSSGYVFMAKPALAFQEFAHVRPAISGLLGPGEPQGSFNMNGSLENDRGVAAYLDSLRLPAGSVALDSGPGFAVLAATANPKQFIITSDRDFRGAVIDPVGHHVRYLLMNRNHSQFDQISATWPSLAAGNATVPWAQLDVEFPFANAPGMHDWVLWRVIPTQ